MAVAIEIPHRAKAECSGDRHIPLKSAVSISKEHRIESGDILFLVAVKVGDDHIACPIGTLGRCIVGSAWREGSVALADKHLDRRTCRTDKIGFPSPFRSTATRSLPAVFPASDWIGPAVNVPSPLPNST